MHLRTTTCLTAFALASIMSLALGQAAPAPAPAPSGPVAPAAAAPTAFPPVDPTNFTATSPTKDTVEAFLHAYWGYDTTRQWQVQAILPTPATGVSHVLILVRSTGGANAKEQTSQLSFFTLPDGKYLVADSLLPFGVKPFQAYREVLQEGAMGPSRGGTSKALELVEFSDFECPHCKEALPIVDKLLADYPSAHFVYQDFPLVHVHSEAMKASIHGYCVTKAGGNDAFFKFANALFDNQPGLVPATSDQTLKDAETKAGQDPMKIATCAATPAAKDAITASMALGEKVGVNSTPTIFVNGRGLPLVGIPYPLLQKIIEFQAQLDGVSLPPAVKVPPPPPKAAPSLR